MNQSPIKQRPDRVVGAPEARLSPRRMSALEWAIVAMVAAIAASVAVMAGALAYKVLMWALA